MIFQVDLCPPWLGIHRLASGKRYVLNILPETNTVVLGEREGLMSAGLSASRVNWLIDTPTAPLRCTIKIRYRNAGSPGVVTVTPNDGASVVFDEPQSAVTPGQSVVFYEGSRVLGGGWIESRVG